MTTGWFSSILKSKGSGGASRSLGMAVGRVDNEGIGVLGNVGGADTEVAMAEE